MHLTVVVSTYNQEKYISDCLASVVDNLPNEQCEIIVADDCSIDGTGKIVENFSKNYPGLILHLRGEKNVGPNLNYLRAHSAAIGKYVAHVDGDDIVYAGKFIKQILIMEKREEVAIVVHAAQYFSDDRKLILNTGMVLRDQESWDFTREQVARWGPVAVHSSFMYRKRSLELTKVVLPFMEWQIAMLCLSKGVGTFINERLIGYRNNPYKGAAMTATKKGRIWAYKIQEENVISFFYSNSDLKNALYAQLVVNFVAKIKTGTTISWSSIQFLFNQMSFFSLFQIIDAFYYRFYLMPRKK